MKVYGGSIYLPGQRHGGGRVIIAASSQTEAAAILGVSPWWFRRYFCETGNAGEIATAMATPYTKILVAN